MKRFLLAILTSTALAFAVACTSQSGGNAQSSGAGGFGGGSPDSGVVQSDGGGVDDGGTSVYAPPPPPASQCNDVATAFCKIEAQCDTADMQANFAGNMTTCLARTAYFCPSLTDPGTGNNATTLEACATAIGQIATCSAYLAYLAANDSNICPPVAGSLSDGTTCNDDSQCKGGYCGPSTDGGSCGACAEKPGTTACVENSDCAQGQLCNARSSCVTPGAAGATCDSNDPSQAASPCAPGLYCKGAGDDGGAPDGGSGVCAPLAAQGAACDGTDTSPECADGLVCSATANQCVKVQFVAPGAACDGVLTVCAGGQCVTSNGNTTGVCKAYLPDGSKCVSDTDCEFAAGCVNGFCTTQTASCN